MADRFQTRAHPTGCPPPSLTPDPSHLWVRLIISAPRTQTDLISGVLHSAHTLGLEESVQGARVRLTAYFQPVTKSQRVRRQVEQALCQLSIPDSQVECQRITWDPNHWVAAHRRHFRGFPVGSTIYIHPAWERPPRHYPVRLKIEPGCAFGTGSHASTQLCLRALETSLSGATSMLDLGTGSGVLAIAARKLRPSLKVAAIDNDEQALQEARRNFARNELRALLAVAEPSALQGSFDLVVANLDGVLLPGVANDLVRLADKLLIVSGFTKEQESQIQRALQHPGWIVQTRLLDGDWVYLCLEASRDDHATHPSHRDGAGLD